MPSHYSITCLLEIHNETYWYCVQLVRKSQHPGTAFSFTRTESNVHIHRLTQKYVQILT